MGKPIKTISNEIMPLPEPCIFIYLFINFIIFFKQLISVRGHNNEQNRQNHGFSKVYILLGKSQTESNHYIICINIASKLVISS